MIPEIRRRNSQLALTPSREPDLGWSEGETIGDPEQDEEATTLHVVTTFVRKPAATNVEPDTQLAYFFLPVDVLRLGINSPSRLSCRHRLHHWC